MGLVRRVKLLPEVDCKLVRYAELRGLKPEAVMAEATERHLKEEADLVLRIADARRIAEKHHGPR